MTGRLAESAFAVPALTNAWQEVLANDRDLTWATIPGFDVDHGIG